MWPVASQIDATPLEVPADSGETSEDERDPADDGSLADAEADRDSTTEPAEAPKKQTASGRQETEAPTRSGYDDIPTAGGPTSVESDLRADDEFKNPVFTFLQWAIAPLYDFKDTLYVGSVLRIRLAF